MITINCLKLGVSYNILKQGFPNGGDLSWRAKISKGAKEGWGNLTIKNFWRI